MRIYIGPYKMISTYPQEDFRPVEVTVYKPAQGTECTFWKDEYGYGAEDYNFIDDNDQEIYLEFSIKTPGLFLRKNGEIVDGVRYPVMDLPLVKKEIAKSIMEFYSHLLSPETRTFYQKQGL